MSSLNKKDDSTDPAIHTNGSGITAMGQPRIDGA